MNTLDTSIKADKAAIALSVLCVIHCLFTPALVVALPALSSVIVDAELYHRIMVFFVVPTSVYALTLGCKEHQRYPLMILGVLGLAILCFATLWGGQLFGHTGEIALTLIGSLIVVSGHVINFRLCRACGHCD
ncbi:MAG: MerC domain-containing protein [Pseudomonadota bacterium]